MTESVSSRLCFLALGGWVEVSVGPRLIAHVSMVRHCGSPWCCPICSPVVRVRRGQEVTQGIGKHLEDGGGGLFVTFTAQHDVEQELAPLLSTMTKALGLCLQGRGWKDRRDSLGYVGSIRSVEITYGANGWHPHTHAVLLFDRPLTPRQIAEFRTWLFGRWQSVVSRRGFGQLHPVKGLDVRPVLSDGVGEYVTKVEGGWSVGAELTAAGGKSTLHPEDFLNEYAENGCLDSLRHWLDYEAATRGQRFLVWSKGLRARLLGDEEGESDEAIAAAEGEDVRLVVVRIEAAEWAMWVRSGEVGQLLSAIEEMAAVWLFMAGVFGDRMVTCDA